MSTILLLLILIVAWIIVYRIVTTIGKKYFSPYGPAVLIKTQIGVRTIEKVSKSKFWDYFVSFFYYALPIFAIATIGLLIWEAFLVLSIPKSAAPPLSYALAIPGINPAIPVSFGIVGLIVAVAFHEASHGIAARRFNIPVRSTGVLWLIIPVGAFVEPDEEVLKERNPKTRSKVFAAGPGMNISLAVVFLVLSIILAYAMVPVPGAPVQSSVNPSLQPGDVLQAVNGIPVANVGTISNLSISPGSYVNLSLIRGGQHITERSMYGLYVTQVTSGYAAGNAGVESGDVILSIGNYSIDNTTTFVNVLGHFQANQTTSLKVFNGTSVVYYQVTLSSRYSYLISLGDKNPGISKSYPFLGVNVATFGVLLFDQYSYINLLRNPTSDGPLGFFIYLGLPFHSELPLTASLLSSFSVNPMLLNMEYLFYWLFWLNFALGLTNLMPIVPFDGGYYLMNVSFLQKNKKLRDAVVTLVSLSLVFLILWQFIAPRI